MRPGDNIELEGPRQRRLETQDPPPPSNPHGTGENQKTVSAVQLDSTSEHTYLGPKDLGMIDVAALIINKMIGTGIFTTPGLVLSLTGNKTISLILWICGGVWATLW